VSLAIALPLGLAWTSGPRVSIPLSTPLTLRKISSFQLLPIGWDYGRGVPASTSTAERARSIYNSFTQLGFVETDAFPGSDGEIMVTAYKDDYYLECLVEIDGTYTIIAEKNRSEFLESSHVQERDALSAINKAAGVIWNTSNLSNQASMMSAGASSKALRLENRQVIMALP
jgi:hypothetical protein